VATQARTFIVVDASVMVSRLVPQDIFHTAVKTWLNEQRAAGVEFVSPAFLLPEVGGAVSRRTAASHLGKEAVEILQNLPGLRLVEMDATLIREAAHLAADLSLRGADATYVAVAARLNLPLTTLDEDQKTRATKRVSIQEILNH
jgi:predicted nucleic acid-binding protein